MAFATDLGTQVTPGVQTRRGPFVPPWYLPHPDLSIHVMDGNTDLGFSIGDVAPERRWAVGHDGRVVGDHDFVDRYRDWMRGQYAWRNPPHPVPDLSFEPIPSRIAFVSKGVDPTNDSRLVELAEPVVRISQNKKRESVVDIESLRRQGWQVAPPRAQDMEGAMAEIERLRSLLEAQSSAPKKRGRKPLPLVIATCGKEVKGENGKRLHEMRCKKCSPSGDEAA